MLIRLGIYFIIILVGIVIGIIFKSILSLIIAIFFGGLFFGEYLHFDDYSKRLELENDKQNYR